MLIGILLLGILSQRPIFGTKSGVNRSCSCKSHTPVIDGIHDADNIALYFSNLLTSDSSSTCASLLGQIKDNLVSEI